MWLIKISFIFILTIVDKIQAFKMKPPAPNSNMKYLYGLEQLILIL